MAMLAGVLLLGAFAWWTRRSGAQRATDPEFGRILGVLPLALGVVALVAVVLLRRAVAQDRDPARGASLRLIGWAVGEAAALTGGVGYLLTGNVTSYLIGLAVLVFTFVGLPLPDRS
jgi:hypothetical protein